MNSVTSIIEGNNDKEIKTGGNLENKSDLVELNRMYQDSALVDQGVREGECENVSESGKRYPLTRRTPDQQQTSLTEPTTARRVGVDKSCSEIQGKERAVTVEQGDNVTEDKSEILESKSGLVGLNRMNHDSALVGVNRMDTEIIEGGYENVNDSGKKHSLTRRIPEQRPVSEYVCNPCQECEKQ